MHSKTYGVASMREPFAPVNICICKRQVLASMRSKIFDGSIEFIARRLLHTFSFIPMEKQRKATEEKGKA